MSRYLFFIGFFFLAVSLHAQEDFEVASLRFEVPVQWKSVTPASPMRAGQWNIVSKKGAAEVAAFYFGAGQGGDADSSVQRWLGTMSNPQGGAVEHSTKTRTVNGLKVTELIAYGTYASGMPMPGVPPMPKPGYGLIGTVIEGPQGNIFVRMTGPEVTVKDEVATFRKFIDSAKPVN